MLSCLILLLFTMYSHLKQMYLCIHASALQVHCKWFPCRHTSCKCTFWYTCCTVHCKFTFWNTCYTVHCRCTFWYTYYTVHYKCLPCRHSLCKGTLVHMLGCFSPQLQPLCPAHAIRCLSSYSLHDDQLLVRPCVAPFIV